MTRRLSSSRVTRSPLCLLREAIAVFPRIGLFEDFIDFFEGEPLGLHYEEIDDNKFENVPYQENHVDWKEVWSGQHSWYRESSPKPFHAIFSSATGSLKVSQ